MLKQSPVAEPRRARGDEVVWRSRPQGSVGYVFAAFVVEDADDAIALFQPAGGPCMRRVGVRGGPGGRQMVAGGWRGEHESVVFGGPRMVRVHPAGSAYAVLRPWVDGAWGGWYVNLEQPWRRTPVGFDTRDDTLDIVVADDLSSWTWKDDDELAWEVESGKITAADADVMRATGERAVAQIAARDWPFQAAAWSRWQPDPSWSVLSMPKDWDVPFYPPPASL